MSQQNVDLVRGTLGAFARGDIDAAFVRFDREVEWKTADDEPDAHTYFGVPAIRRFVEHLADPWRDRFGPGIEFQDFIDCGDWVVAPWTGRVHGHGSGIEIDISETYAVHVRGGLIVRVEEYRTVDEALSAVRPPK